MTHTFHERVKVGVASVNKPGNRVGPFGARFDAKLDPVTGCKSLGLRPRLNELGPTALATVRNVAGVSCGVLVPREVVPHPRHV